MWQLFCESHAQFLGDDDNSTWGKVIQCVYFRRALGWAHRGEISHQSWVPVSSGVRQSRLKLPLNKQQQGLHAMDCGLEWTLYKMSNLGQSHLDLLKKLDIYFIKISVLFLILQFLQHNSICLYKSSPYPAFCPQGYLVHIVWVMATAHVSTKRAFLRCLM